MLPFIGKKTETEDKNIIAIDISTGPLPKPKDYWTILKEKEAAVERCLQRNTDPKLTIVNLEACAKSDVKRWDPSRLEKRTNSFRIIRDR